jgi:hypothetical protein
MHADGNPKLTREEHDNRVGEAAATRAARLSC